jgi:hypothetical protein
LRSRARLGLNIAGAWGSGSAAIFATPNGASDMDQIAPLRERRGIDECRATDVDHPLAEQIDALSEMPVVDLRAKWRRHYRCHPPKQIRRDLLELGLAWKLQEIAIGGLSASAKRHIRELIAAIETTGGLSKPRTVRPGPGARLVRDWRGETHDVLVTETGFEWKDRTWPSLSQIAREITGTRWSGPRFFGLERPPPKSSAEARHG